MRYKEITETHSIAPTKPLTPQQARLDALKRQKENVSKALDSERQRQRIAKAQQQLAKAIKPTPQVG